MQGGFFKAFPWGKVAADGLPQTDEGALDIELGFVFLPEAKTQKSNAPLIRLRKNRPQPPSPKRRLLEPMRKARQ